MHRPTQWRLAEGAAFTPDGMAAWLNEVRPEGTPETTAAQLLTSGGYAEYLDETFRSQAKWWGA